MADNDTIYRFLDKGHIHGIPARDLTQDDYDRLTTEHQRDVRSGKLYEPAGEAGGEAGGNGSDLDAMTRDALNAHALMLGIADPGDRERYPNKDAVIDAIAAATQEGGN